MDERMERTRNGLGIRALMEDTREEAVREAKLEILYQLIDTDIRLQKEKEGLSELTRTILSLLHLKAEANPNEYDMESIFYNPYVLVDEQSGTVYERKADFSKLLIRGELEEAGKVAETEPPESQEEIPEIPEENRHYLEIPPAPKSVEDETEELFQKNGARYDKEKHSWYIVKKEDEETFRDFLSEDPVKKPGGKNHARKNTERTL